jgi:hypothetical protein
VCCAAFAARHFRPVLRSDGLRIALCILAAVGVYSDELVGTATNVQWYLFLLGTLLVIHPPHTTVHWRAWLWGFTGFVLAAANPLLILGLPVMGGLLLVQRQWPAAVQRGLLIGLAVQCLLSRFGTWHVPAGIPQLQQIPEFMRGVVDRWVQRVLETLFCGHNSAVELISQTPESTTFIVGCVSLAGLVFVALSGPRAERGRVWVAIYFIFVSFTIPYLLRNRLSAILSSEASRDERYYFLPALATLYVLASYVERLTASAREWGRAAIFLLPFCRGIPQNAPLPPYSDTQWSTQAVRIEAWRNTWRNSAESPTISIRINPDWAMLLPGKLANGGFEQWPLIWRSDTMTDLTPENWTS